ncbi:TPA: 50S ribosomal protein L13 [Candidatus Saccharibacteria bacterium]|nr:MAG: 50S ribosomal protein L13 [Candidatus Saccharibacteria bacterium RIFCSPHIGHO2_12_FULL_47_17]HCM51836.1 50S ribosomal protein L13 [Candidatus Saccharibacteria bacterium]
MKTYSAKPKDITRSWYLLDASTMTLGRLSTVAASLLIGKGKPQFTPHIDVGDYVIVTNAVKLTVTGNKKTGKDYWRHSGFPGGLYKRTLTEQMTRDPLKVVIKSVRGMLPVNKLRPARLKRLKVYAGTNHEHVGQKPIEYSNPRETKYNGR